VEKNMTSNNWRVNRKLAEDKLKELWENGDYDQPLYLVKDDLGDLELCYHIISKYDFDNSPHWGGVKFVKSAGEENVAKED
jgi:hypothetical protein